MFVGEGRQETHVCEDDWLLRLLQKKHQELSPILTEVWVPDTDNQTHKRTFTLLMHSLVAHNS